ncbi:MAG TPA: response regulator [Tepidisphaeraceae bacterium]|nr:response regulator [Tepidisphaeraceae bacterium]
MSDRILIIDDDPRLVEALSLRLCALGYEVRTACCGRDGLHIAREFRPQLIVLDINMPHMNGYEVCRHVRSDPHLHHTPLIVLSAIDHDTARQAALAAGADKFLAKPYLASHLTAEIRAAIDASGVGLLK